MDYHDSLDHPAALILLGILLLVVIGWVVPSTRVATAALFLALAFFMLSLIYPEALW